MTHCPHDPMGKSSLCREGEHDGLAVSATQRRVKESREYDLGGVPVRRTKS
jgi:hypothetical protein